MSPLVSLAPPAGEFEAPDIAFAAVAPVLVVFGVGVLSVLVEAFVARRLRPRVQTALAAGGLAVALGALVAYTVTRDGDITTAAGAIVVDGPALFLQGTVLVLGLLAVLTMGDRSSAAGDPFTAQAAAVTGSPEEAAARGEGLVQTEVFPMALFAIGGMLVFPAANDLLTLFVALEVLSLPLYLLCGLARRRRLLSQEASLKYFLLGAFSSAIFLFGAALLYGFSGSVRLSAIAEAILARDTTAPVLAPGQDLLLLLGAAMVLVGLLFKVSAAPFHVWTPDVYQGAPTPVTGLMAAGTKVAAFGALLRIVYVALGWARWDWQPALFVVAILTMAVGSVVAIVQADVKRMLAYSSIAHAGFLMVGLLAMDAAGISAVLFYLVAYGLTTIGAFAVVTQVRATSADGGIGGEATHLSQWAGLGRRSPLVAGAFALFLLAFAGIPLTSGFIGKFTVFSAAFTHFTDSVPQGGTWLVVVGVLSSAVAAFFYVRVIVLMYFSEPSGEAGTVTATGPLTAIVVTLGAVATVVLGVYPSLVLNLAGDATTFLP